MNPPIPPPAERAAEAEAEAVLRAEVAARGPLPFSRFMELALYAPGVGYYQRVDRPVGRQGDFYTSVSVGPVFGFLLAARFAEWAGQDGRFDLVEAAAHDGHLAQDLLAALREFHPAVWERVRYWILEPFPAREAAQRRTLEAWGDRVRWIPGVEALPEPVAGVLFANELLDAFPVRRFGWDAGARVWFEWGVRPRPGSGWEWCRLEGAPADPGFEVPPALAAVLPDGFVAETSPAAVDWWRAAARRLRPGAARLATWDYGFDAPLPLRPERPEGSLRAYFRHRLESDVLARPGSQDLTAHVDFAGIARAGESEGLVTESLLPQGRWLGQVASAVLGGGGPAAAWLQGRARGLQTLLDPRLLGASFHALVQRRPGPDAP